MSEISESKVHAEVSRAYTEALRRSKEGQSGCCSPAAECSPAAQLAGYDEEREAYARAAASSFGCGNPLAFAGVEPGQTVLDLGSGGGFDLLIAAEKVGPNGKVGGASLVVGTTPSKMSTPLALARKAAMSGLVAGVPVGPSASTLMSAGAVTTGGVVSGVAAAAYNSEDLIRLTEPSWPPNTRTEAVDSRAA